MLDVSKLTELQKTSLQQALALLERPPLHVLPPGEDFWRGMAAAMKLRAATEGLSPEATEWISGEFLRRLRDVPWIPPDQVRRKQAPTVIAGLYHFLGHRVYETLRDWHASALQKGPSHG